MKAYDSDKDLRLNRDEFVEFARSLVKNGALQSPSRIRACLSRWLHGMSLNGSGSCGHGSSNAHAGRTLPFGSASRPPPCCKLCSHIYH